MESALEIFAAKTHLPCMRSSDVVKLSGCAVVVQGQGQSKTIAYAMHVLPPLRKQLVIFGCSREKRSGETCLTELKMEHREANHIAILGVP